MIKGVILGIVPDVNIVDLTHNIESFNIRAAAFILQHSLHYFPPETIFLVVVDPGVGSERRILATRAGGYTFVAPDNGVLSYALSQFAERSIVSIENSDFALPEPCATFHGRDIMAPAAAHLATGVGIDLLGPATANYACLPIPNLLRRDNGVIGETVYIDKFGNLISNITRSDLPRDKELSELTCKVGGYDGVRFAANYASAQGLAAIISGFGTVEIFLNQGRAADRFNLPVGTPLAIEG